MAAYSTWFMARSWERVAQRSRISAPHLARMAAQAIVRAPEFSLSVPPVAYHVLYMRHQTPSVACAEPASREIVPRKPPSVLPVASDGAPQRASRAMYAWISRHTFRNARHDCHDMPRLGRMTCQRWRAREGSPHKARRPSVALWGDPHKPRSPLRSPQLIHFVQDLAPVEDALRNRLHAIEPGTVAGLEARVS
jgi:hypothetical protein